MLARYHRRRADGYMTGNAVEDPSIEYRTLGTHNSLSNRAPCCISKLLLRSTLYIRTASGMLLEFELTSRLVSVASR